MQKKTVHSSVLLSVSEIFFGVLGSFVSLYLFFKIADEILETERFFLDHEILMWFYEIRTPLLTEIIKGITFFGNIYFLGFLSVSILFFFLIKKKYHEMIFFSSLFYSGVILNLILKDFFNRPRPELDPLVFEQTQSFPSGHAMNSFVFYFAIVYFFYHFRRQKGVSLLLGMGATILVLSIGISRIYLGVHYPTDVLGGFAGGFFWLMTALVVDKVLALRTIHNTLL